MIDPQKFDNKVLSVYADNLYLGVFKNMNIVKQALESDKFPIGFNERDINIITNELLYYFLNICDRLLHDIYGNEIKMKIMDSLIDLIAKNLDEVKNDILDERLVDLDQKKFGIYLKILRTTYDSQAFVLTYNKRQKEYESYLPPFGDTKPGVLKSLEYKYVEFIKSQIFGLKEKFLPVADAEMILWSIPMETHFYKQLYKVIFKVEARVGLSDIVD